MCDELRINQLNTGWRSNDSPFIFCFFAIYFVSQEHIQLTGGLECAAFSHLQLHLSGCSPVICNSVHRRYFFVSLSHTFSMLRCPTTAHQVTSLLHAPCIRIRTKIVRYRANEPAKCEETCEMAKATRTNVNIIVHLWQMSHRSPNAEL